MRLHLGPNTPPRSGPHRAKGASGWGIFTKMKEAVQLSTAQCSGKPGLNRVTGPAPVTSFSG